MVPSGVPKVFINILMWVKQCHKHHKPPHPLVITMFKRWCIFICIFTIRTNGFMAVFSPHYWDLLGLSWVLNMFQMDLWMANSMGYTFHAAVTTWGFPRLAQQTFSKPSRAVDGTSGCHLFWKVFKSSKLFYTVTRIHGGYSKFRATKKEQTLPLSRLLNHAKSPWNPCGFRCDVTSV